MGIGGTNIPGGTFVNGGYPGYCLIFGVANLSASEICLGEWCSLLPT